MFCRVKFSWNEGGANVFLLGEWGGPISWFCVMVWVMHVIELLKYNSNCLIYVNLIRLGTREPFDSISAIKGVPIYFWEKGVCFQCKYMFLFGSWNLKIERSRDGGHIFIMSMRVTYWFSILSAFLLNRSYLSLLLIVGFTLYWFTLNKGVSLSLYFAGGGIMMCIILGWSWICKCI